MKRPALLAFTLCSLLAACGGRKTTEAAAAESVKTVAVTTAPVDVREVQADFEVTGTFVADEQSDIAPPVPGRVVATPVDVGAFVKQGQIICELDHRDAQLRLEQAQAQLASANAGVRQAQSRIGWSSGTFDPNKVPEVAAARANFESAQAQARLAAADAQRFANLVASGDVSKSAYEKAKTAQDTAEAQANAARQQYEAAVNGARQSVEVISGSQSGVQNAQSLVAQAQKNLADTTIRAPFDGFITARPVAAGEYVGLADKIATLVRIGTLKLDLQTPEQRAALAHKGDKVLARVAAYPDRDFEGRVTAINQSVDPNSRAFILQARFANPNALLKPGMFATARVLQPGGVQAVFAPRKAVLRDKTTDSNQCFVIVGGKSHLRVVQTGEVTGDLIRIPSGLAAGEVVATSNLTELYDGAPVTNR